MRSSDGKKGAGDGTNGCFDDVKEGLVRSCPSACSRLAGGRRRDVGCCASCCLGRPFTASFTSHRQQSTTPTMPSTEDVYSNDQDWYPGSTHSLPPPTPSDDSSQSVSAQNQAKLPTKQYTIRHRTCKPHFRPPSHPLLTVTRMA